MASVDRILIVGGGIGGLPLATALHRRGFTPELVERSPEWRTTGGGIGVLANGMRMLRVLGLDEAVAQAGAVLRRMAFSNSRGEVLCNTDLEALWVGVRPCIGIERTKLQEVLIAGAAAVPARLGISPTGLIEGAGRVIVDFSDGPRADYDLVVGSDGIHSTVRQLAIGGHRRAMPGRWYGAASSRSAHEGHEVDTQGDSFFVVFPRATQTVAAAVTIQRALAAETCPEGGAVRVRIGLHTGEPIRTAAGYTGLDVVRGARIKEAGHGGQVLLSKATAALIEDPLIDGLTLRDLGVHRLKGLPRPERIFQLIMPDLPADFLPLRSLDARGRARPSLAPGRVLTTVLFVDWFRATERLVALGDRRWLELQAQYTALVRQELARHGGEEINVVGDQILAVFDGAAAGIRCGCAIRDAVQGLGITGKVGIHAGEVESDDRTMSGITVFTAVRITAIAQPGEILVSHTVKELVAGSGITFTDRGTHTLRGLPGEWRLFTPDVPEAGAHPS